MVRDIERTYEYRSPAPTGELLKAASYVLNHEMAQ